MNSGLYKSKYWVPSMYLTWTNVKSTFLRILKEMLCSHYNIYENFINNKENVEKLVDR